MIRAGDFLNSVTACVLIAALAQHSGMIVRADCPMSWRQGLGPPGTDGDVYATVTWDPDGAGPRDEVLVAGGEFSIAGNSIVNKIAMWNGVEWLPLGGGFGGPGGPDDIYVRALTVFNGDLIAGGTFTTAESQTVNYIARWDGTNWHPMGSGMNSNVSSLTVFNGELIAGGYFTTAGGVSANAIAKWDGNGWSPLSGGMTNGGVYNSVRAMVVFNGELFAGGFFQKADGLNINNCARWDGIQWRSANSLNAVYSLAVHNNQVVVGSAVYGSSSSNGVGYWNGTTWKPLGTGIGTVPVSALISYDGELIAGGQFTNLSGGAANYIAHWNGHTWAPFPDSPESFVYAFSIYHSRLVVGGVSFLAGNQPARHIAEWNGKSWSPIGAGIDARVDSVSVSHGKLIVGGRFVTIDGGDRSKIASWNGSTWESLSSGMNLSVLATADYKGDLIAGGSFTTAGGASVSYIARWDGQDWHPLGSGLNSSVYSLFNYDDSLIAVGPFTSAGGVAANNVARWDGATWSAIGTGIQGVAPDYVKAIAVYQNELIVAGKFSSAGGSSANNIARWDGKAWNPLGSGTDNTVRCLYVSDGELTAGGSFLHAGGTYSERAAVWNGQSWQAFASGPNNGYVYSLSNFNGALIAGGYFDSAWGTQANNIILRTGGAWQALGAGAEVNGPDYTLPIVASMTRYNNELVVAGQFTSTGGVVSSYLGRYGPACPCGDLNCDQLIDTNDIPDFVAAILDPASQSDCQTYLANVNADVNPDGTGKLDAQDVVAFTAAVLTSH